VTSAQILVIDPALRRPELDALNAMAQLSPLPLSYHMPAMFGFDSFQDVRDETLRGIVVLGSGSSVNDRRAWQERLETWLRPRLERGVPTLGICYGHQMLARMFGGKVGWIYPDGSKYLQLREISLAAELPPHVPAAWRNQRGPVVVSHQEHVSVIPKAMRILASSPTVACEGLVHETLPIYSFQSHPEAVPGTARGFGLARVAAAPQSRAFGQSLVRGFLAYAATKAP
jgi:GMP synthase-like glutamine amidotransferase